jgi:hypothetical protein
MLNSHGAMVELALVRLGSGWCCSHVVAQASRSLPEHWRSHASDTRRPLHSRSGFRLAEALAQAEGQGLFTQT